MPAWCRPPTSLATATPTATSPSAAGRHCESCCVKPRTMRSARIIPCIRTSPACARSAATRWPSSRSPIASAAFSLRCCATARTSMSPSSPSKRACSAARRCSASGSSARRRAAHERGAGLDDGLRDDSVSPMTTLNHEHATPERLVSPQLGLTCGAVLPGTKRGATVSTPNGRLVSEDVIGRRTQSPPDPRAARRRSSPTHTRMRLSRSPPSRNIVSPPSARGPRTLPPSSLTVRLHGRPSYRGGGLRADGELHGAGCAARRRARAPLRARAGGEPPPLPLPPALRGADLPLAHVERLHHAAHHGGRPLLVEHAPHAPGPRPRLRRLRARGRRARPARFPHGAVRGPPQLDRHRGRARGRLRARPGSLPYEPDPAPGRAGRALHAPHLRAGGAAPPALARAARRARAVAHRGVVVPLAARAEAPARPGRAPRAGGRGATPGRQDPR